MRDFRSLFDAAAELMSLREVEVALSKLDLPGQPLRRVRCECCGEGVNDGREETCQGRVLSRFCAGNGIGERPRKIAEGVARAAKEWEMSLDMPAQGRPHQAF